MMLYNAICTILFVEEDGIDVSSRGGWVLLNRQRATCSAQWCFVPAMPIKGKYMV